MAGELASARQSGFSLASAAMSLTLSTDVPHLVPFARWTHNGRADNTSSEVLGGPPLDRTDGHDTASVGRWHLPDLARKS
jgi:hypothetical protein